MRKHNVGFGGGDLVPFSLLICMLVCENSLGTTLMTYVLLSI